MAWKGGFSGVGFSRAEFKQWLSSQTKPAWVKFMVAHNTAAPYIKPPVSPSTRIKNLGNYYKTLGWSTGPNIIVILDKVYIGTPWQYPGTNSPGFNGIGLGVEVEGDYRTGKHDPKSGDGKVAWDTASWVFADVLTWLGYPNDSAHLKLHREDPKTTHQCPGNLVTKDWLLGKVKEASWVKPPVVEVSPTVLTSGPKNQLYDVKDIQTLLIARGYDLGKWGADGINGKMTDSAIRAFQTSLTVEPTGVLGPWAMGELKKPKQPPAGNVEPPKPVPDPLSPIEVLHPSDFALSWMKRFEGLRLEAYDDRGTWAIGYGHNASSRRPPLPVKGMKITQSDADSILAQDAEAIAAEVRKVLKGTKLKQEQFDALVLDCFQRGQTQFTKTDAVTALRDGRDASAALHAQADRTTDKGLQRRRKVEAQIYDGEKPTKW